MIAKVEAGYTNPDTQNDFASFMKNNHISHSTWQIKKFAAKVKEICSLLTGIPVEDFEKEEVKSSYLGEEWSLRDLIGNHVSKGGRLNKIDTADIITVRELLQKVGTDAMRDVIHPDVWVNALMNNYWSITHLKDNAPFSCHHDLTPEFKEKYVKFIEYPNWIITDVRFPNEAKAIKDKGGMVVRVDRRSLDVEKIQKAIKETGGYLPNEHESETSLDDYHFDYTIDNSGTIENLIENVKVMLKYFNLIQ